MSLTQITTGGVDENINIDSNTLKVDGTNNRVGIGTSSPQRALVVSDAGTEGFEFYPGSSSGNNTVNHYNRSTASFVNSITTADQHIFGRADGEKVRIDSSGNLGLGTSSPGSFDSEANNLVVGNGAGDNGITIFGGSSAGDYGSIFFADSSSGGAAKRGQIRYEQNNEVMSFHTAETERLRIDLSGNVGIGTASPGSYSSAANELVVAGTSNPGITIAGSSGNTGTIMFADGTSGSEVYRGQIDYQHASDAMVFFTNGGSERMRILSDGTIATGGLTATPGTVAAGSYIQHAANAGFFGNNGDAKFGSSANNSVLFQVNGSEKARIDTSGRLLVGTSSSADQNAKIQSATTGYEVFEGFQHGSNTVGAILRLAKSRGSIGSQGLVSDGDELGRISFLGSDGGGYRNSAYIKCEVDGAPGTNDMPGALVLATTADGSSSPTERMRLTQKGVLKVSNNGTYINANSPYNEFTSTYGNEYAFRIKAAGVSGQQFGLRIETVNDQNDEPRLFFSCVGGSTTRAVIRSNGGLVNYQSNNVNLCDEREKKNIVSLDAKWDKVKSWELKKFHYNEDADTDDKRYGVIAQQVEEHCPEVLTEWLKQEAQDAVLDEDGNVVTPAVPEILRKGVKEQQMMWMAIKALQEAQARIETLETKVAALEAG